MRPVRFPESNTTWAEHQPPYLPLPAYSDSEVTVSLWALTWRERLSILFRGRLWLSQMNFGQPLQPQKIQIDSPFAESGL